MLFLIRYLPISEFSLLYYFIHFSAGGLYLVFKANNLRINPEFNPIRIKLKFILIKSKNLVSFYFQLTMVNRVQRSWAVRLRHKTSTFTMPYRLRKYHNSTNLWEWLSPTAELAEVLCYRNCRSRLFPYRK